MGQYEDNDMEKTDEDKKELKEKIEKLQKHTCLKNFDGYLKSMESDALVCLVSGASRLLDCYTCSIVMDDDTNTRKNLQENQGPKSAG